MPKLVSLCSNILTSYSRRRSDKDFSKRLAEDIKPSTCLCYSTPKLSKHQINDSKILFKIINQQVMKIWQQKQRFLPTLAFFTSGVIYCKQYFTSC